MYFCYKEWIGGYDLINETNYKMEGNDKPTVEEAKANFMGLAENVRIEKCRINYEVLKALSGKK